MANYVIMADATCDLSEEIQKQYDIAIVPTHISLPGKREIPSFLKWEEFDRDSFYADLKAHPADYATAPPNVEEFAAAFEPYASKGVDILLLTISGGISGTYNFALAAQKRMAEKYPNVTVRCIDTLRFSVGFGLIVMQAAIQRDAGMSLEENAAWIEANKNRYHQAGWLDDLSFVAKKGRMTHAKAFFGTLAGIKPLGEFDYNGLTTVICKVKGAKAAYAALMDYMSHTIEAPEEQVVIIGHTCRQAQAEAYRKLIEDAFHPKAVLIADVFPMNGISIGPGLMAAYYRGKPISEGLVEERAIYDRFTGGGGR